MIEVQRLDGRAFVVNAELIELIEATPDTVISLVNGKKLLVRDTLDEVVARAIAYKRAVAGCPQGEPNPEAQAGSARTGSPTAVPDRDPQTTTDRGESDG